MKRRAILSKDGRLRWVLERRWGNGKPACWVMLNPSTADHRVDDPTIREVIRFTRLWGYDAAVVVNLYPFRTSSPAECRRWADWENGGPDWHVRDVIHEGGVLIGRKAREAALVIAAWGAAPWARDWAEYVVGDVITAGDIPCPAVYCLGKNRDGSPKHPLARGRHRVPRDQKPEPFAEGFDG